MPVSEQPEASQLGKKEAAWCKSNPKASGRACASEQSSHCQQGSWGRGNASEWEEQHLCLLSWSLKKPRRPAPSWEWQRGMLSPALQAWTGSVVPNRGGWMAGKEQEAAGHLSPRAVYPSTRGSARVGCFEHPWSCDCPACGAVLSQPECPVLLGPIFCPAVLLEQHQPTQSNLQSGSSGSGWPRVLFPAPIGGWLQHPREPLILGRKDPGALHPHC